MHGAVIYPLEVLLHGGYILAGRTHLGAVRGTTASVVVLALLWLLSSASADVMIAQQVEPDLLLGPVLEISLLSILLWHLVKDKPARWDRYWKIWMAVAGVSVMLWGLAAALILMGVGPFFAVMLSFGCFIRGYGQILSAATDGEAATPYTTAAWVLFGMSIVMSAFHTALRTIF